MRRSKHRSDIVLRELEALSYRELAGCDGRSVGNRRVRPVPRRRAFRAAWNEQLKRSAKWVMAGGLEGVVAAFTRLSCVDGEAGRLTLAGYAVEDLAPSATFEEVAYLFLNGRLPSALERGRLAKDLAERRAPTTRRTSGVPIVRRRNPPRLFRRTTRQLAVHHPSNFILDLLCHCSTWST